MRVENEEVKPREMGMDGIRGRRKHPLVWEGRKGCQSRKEGQKTLGDGLVIIYALLARKLVLNPEATEPL